MGSLIARAFWGPRPQAVDEGVAAIFTTLVGLRDLSSGHYSQWFDVGRSRRDALRRQVAIEPSAIQQRLERNSEGGRAFEDLGWTFSVWNGAGDDDALKFTCNFSVTSPWVTNSVVFDLPAPWEQDLGAARRALDIVVGAWRPEQANVWNSEHIDLLVADL